VHDLRPGCTKRLRDFPNFQIDKEIPPLIQLYENFKGSWDDTLAAVHPRGQYMLHISDCEVYMTNENQTGNDDVLVTVPVLIFNQTKSRLFESEKKAT